MVMLTDGIKFRDQQQQIKNMDLAELLAENLGI
jgi:hypothetical protein